MSKGSLQGTMHRGVHWILLLFALVSLFVGTAKAAPRVDLEVTADVVGVGQSFRVRSTILEEDGQPAPRSPKISIRGKAEVRGPSLGSQHSFVMRGFSMKSERRVQASWVVTPTKVGKIRVGPVSFDVAGKRVASDSIVVEVTDQPQAAPSPFDLLRQRRRHIQMQDAPSEYRLSRATDPTAFLHAKLSKKRVVLGEPVRLEVLAYGARGDFMEHSPKAPALGSFLSHTVVENSEAEPPYQVTIGARRFIVRKIREFVLVPLRTGQLIIEPMTAIVQGRMRHNYPPQGHPQGFLVRSSPLELEVVAAPEDGKPSGFVPGDVGRYRLEADVSPLKISEGSYVEVVISIRGRGQIPSKVILPEGRDLVWEKPTIRGGPEIQDGILKGRRALKYTIQVNKTGEVQLGEVRLPHYDPEGRTYRDATANLGSVTVTPAATRPVARGTRASLPESDPSDPASGVELTAREDLRLLPKNRIAVPLWIWLILVGSPVGMWTFLRLSRLISESLRRRGPRSGSIVKTLLLKARDDVKGERVREALSVLEKAIFEGVREKSGVRARGLLREGVAVKLIEVGCEEVLAHTIQELLIELESLRYGASKEVDLGELLDRVENVLKEMPTLSTKVVSNG